MRKRILFFVCLLSMVACHQKKTEESNEETKTEDVQTPVTVTTVSFENLVDSLELNATSNFLQDNIIKSNINGYIKEVNTKVNQYTNAGKVLFVLKTKEAESLGNTINKLDPSFNFSGVVRIAAPENGYVTVLDHQVGDYVQDGEQLAVISNSKSFGFVLNVPYELHKYVTLNKSVDVVLPDGTVLPGTVSLFMPTLDSVAQTQQVLIKVTKTTNIPENLIAKIRIVKDKKMNVASLPKEAVLTDESQSNFWIMKMIDSVTAVKVPITKGMETSNKVEIIRPQLTKDDLILLKGNYGLPDTAKVKIMRSLE